MADARYGGCRKSYYFESEFFTCSYTLVSLKGFSKKPKYAFFITSKMPYYEWLFIDASHENVHFYGTDANRGNQDMSFPKEDAIPRNIWEWMCWAIHSECLLLQVPQRIVLKLTT